MPPRKKKAWVRTYQSHGLTEMPRLAICPECKLITGLSYLDAVLVRVDLTPLNRLGEMASHIWGIRVYILRPPWSYYRRRAWHLTNEPDTDGAILYRAHHCWIEKVPPEHTAALANPALQELPEQAPY